MWEKWVVWVEKSKTLLHKKNKSEMWGKGVCDIWEKWVVCVTKSNTRSGPDGPPLDRHVGSAIIVCTSPRRSLAGLLTMPRDGRDSEPVDPTRELA